MFGFGKKKVKVGAVFSGTAVSIDQVSDPVFAQGMLGEGFAVIPPADTTILEVVSPVSGTLSKLFKTGHAFAVRSTEGLDILVHVGLETVELKGKGFTVLAAKGDHVEAGTPIVRLDLRVVREAGLNPATPVVFTTKKQVAQVNVKPGEVQALEPVATVTLA